MKRTKIYLNRFLRFSGIIAILILFIISCDFFTYNFNNPVDTVSNPYQGPSVDNDGDGVGSRYDVDEISLASPDNGERVYFLAPELSVCQFGPALVSAYHIQINAASDFSETTMFLDKNDYSSNGCYVPAGTLLDFGTYYWRAKAYDGTKWSDNWSETRSFTVNTGNHFALSPEDGSSLDDTTPYLDWDDIAGAVSYEVEFAAGEAGLDGSDVQPANDLSGYQITDSDSFSYGDTCFWRIRGLNKDGIAGTWSPIHSFHFSDWVYNWSGISPADSEQISDTTPELAWDSIDDAAGYELQLSNLEEGIETAEIFSSDTASYAVSSILTNNTIYYWRIRPVDANGKHGGWSGICSFSINIPLPGLLSPANNSIVSDTTPRLDWEDISGASGYSIQISNNSTFSSILEEDSSLSESNYNVSTELSLDSTYFWQVKTKNEDGVWGDWSSAWRFIIPPPIVDYEISNTSFPGSGFVNKTFSGSFIINNSGNLDGAQSINWSVYRSINSTYDSGVDILIDSGTQTALNEGQSTSTINFNGVWPDNTGTFYLIIVINSSDDENPSNNNTNSGLISVGKEPSGLTISGPSQINENSSGSFSATLLYSDGTSQTVNPSWSENSSYASVNSSGSVTTGNVLANQTFTLTAAHSGQTATKTVTIIYIRVATGIDIDGPSSIDESSSEDYNADLIYDNGSEEAISPSWSLSSYAYADVNSNGLVTADPVTSNKTVTLTASYGSFTDTKTITIENEVISTPSVSSGPTQLENGVSGTFYASSVSSNLGYTVQYQFDWGDGTYSTWSSSRSASHSWSSRGTKSVRVRARSTHNTDDVTESSSRSVAVFTYNTGHTNIWSSTDYDIPDNDGTWISSKLTIPSGIPSGAVITNVWWNFDIDHECPNDLYVYLTIYYNNAWMGDDLYLPGQLGTSGGLFNKSGNSSAYNVYAHNSGQEWFLVAWDKVSIDKGHISYFEINVAYKYKLY